MCVVHAKFMEHRHADLGLGSVELKTKINGLDAFVMKKSYRVLL